jgi:hypothetical protein
MGEYNPGHYRISFHRFRVGPYTGMDGVPPRPGRSHAVDILNLSGIKENQ